MIPIAQKYKLIFKACNRLPSYNGEGEIKISEKEALYLIDLVAEHLVAKQLFLDKQKYTYEQISKFSQF